MYINDNQLIVKLRLHKYYTEEHYVFIAFTIKHDKITDVFTSAAMDDLISKNKDVEKKHKEISKIADKINSKISELKEIDKQMDELSDKYPVLRKL